MAGEYVNPGRLELSRILGKESERTCDWSGAEPNMTQRMELNTARAQSVTHGQPHALPWGLIHP